MKEKSYSEIMKASVMKRIKAKESFVLDLYVDMLISEIQLNTKKEKLLSKIDKAIDERDQILFLTLTEELKDLNKQFGT
ncbi:IDEAL domain-containing protein [Heyndrickxia sp. MSNUG]|uniref:IDEAL domain-containing protein n=1 Tax=Bacillaceae TaxID=186817 RepID=UPI002FFEEE41